MAADANDVAVCQKCGAHVAQQNFAVCMRLYVPGHPGARAFIHAATASRKVHPVRFVDAQCCLGHPLSNTAPEAAAGSCIRRPQRQSCCQARRRVLMEARTRLAVASSAEAASNGCIVGGRRHACACREGFAKRHKEYTKRRVNQSVPAAPSPSRGGVSLLSPRGRPAGPRGTPSLLFRESGKIGGGSPVSSGTPRKNWAVGNDRHK